MLELFYLSILPSALVGLLCALSRVSRPVYARLVALVVLAQSAVVANRDLSLGQDTAEYVAIYNRTAPFIDNIEPGFIFLTAVLRTVSTHPVFFLFFSSCAINGLLVAAYSRLLGRRGLLCFFLFSSTHVYWLAHVQILRNALAAAVFVLGLTWWVSGRRRWSLPLMLLGTTLHYSTAVVTAVTIAALYLRKMSARAWMFIAVAAALGFGVLQYVIANTAFLTAWVDRVRIYEHYNAAYFPTSKFGFQHVPLVILSIVFVFRRRHVPEPARTLFLVYFAITALSLVFWDNVLFRDRFFLPAEMLEPVLAFFAIRFLRLPAKVGVVAATAAGLLWAVAIIFWWGPSSVLQ